MGSMEPIGSAHKRFRSSEAALGHQPPAADSECAKCPFDYTDILLCVSTPQNNPIIETQALETRSIITAETSTHFRHLSALYRTCVHMALTKYIPVVCAETAIYNINHGTVDDRSIVEGTTTSRKSSQRDPRRTRECDSS